MEKTKRKRVIDAIDHTGTHFVPWNIEFTSEFEKKLKLSTGCENAHEFLGNHILRLKYKKNKKVNENKETDIFGVGWKKTKDGGDVGIITYYPLLEHDLKDYSFPAIKEDFAKEICERFLSDKKGYFRAFSLTMCYFERAWSLRTMEELLVDMCLNESFVNVLFESILEHHLKLLDFILDYEFEAVYFGDDWGQQKGLIMGPDYWRKYIKPGMSEMFKKVKSKGKYVILHSCGDLREIMGELIDIGMDVYNTIQPEIYDLKKLKQEYGKSMTFYGGISTQQFLPTASRNECTEVANWMIENIGQDGGLILSPTHAVTPDIPVENVLALVDAAKEYSGVY